MQKIIVDMTPGYRMPTIYFSQGDVGTQFAVDLRSRFGDSLPASATVTVQATKPSGLGFSVAATSVTNGVAVFTTTAEMTDEAGRFPAEIKVVKDSLTMFTANFNMDGEATTHPEGTIDGQQDPLLPELTQLVERVEDAASSVLDMTVEAETLAAGSQATYSYDEGTNTATFGIPQGEAGAGAAGVTASAYSSSSTYAVGDYVIHNSNLYRCTTAITTAEAFTAAHWTQVVLGDDVSDLKSDIKKYEDYTFSDYGQDNLLAYTSFANGKYVDPSSGNLYNNGTWSASDFIEVKGGYQYKCVVADNATWNYAFYDASKGYLSGDSIISDYYWNLSSNVKYVRISMPTMAISSNRCYLTSLSQELNENIKVNATNIPELMNIRVGNDGSVYSSAGDAVRHIGSDLDTYEEYVFSDYREDNVLAYTTYTSGKYVDPSSGNLANNDSWSASDFIEVQGGKQYRCSVANGATWHYAWYDSNKNRVSGDSIIEDYYFNFPSNIKYVRVSMPTAKISGNKLMLVGYSQVLNDNIKVKAKNIIQRENVITVSRDGTKDFTSLRSALESITDSSADNRYVVEYYGDGNTYEITNDFTTSEIEGGSDGLMVPEYTTLKGIGGWEKCRLQATLTEAQSNRYFSAINLKHSSSLENLRIAGIYARNVIHQDWGNENDVESHIENCELIGVNLNLAYVLAAGIGSGCKYTYKNVIFNNQTEGYCYSCHNNAFASTPFTDTARLEFDNCRCITARTDWSFRLGSMSVGANGINCICTLKGTSIPAELMLNEEDSSTLGTGILWKVNGYANEINRVRIYATDGVDYSENIDLI